jgi:hypothetical protein
MPFGGGLPEPWEAVKKETVQNQLAVPERVALGLQAKTSGLGGVVAMP